MDSLNLNGVSLHTAQPWKCLSSLHQDPQAKSQISAELATSTQSSAYHESHAKVFMKEPPKTPAVSVRANRDVTFASTSHGNETSVPRPSSYSMYIRNANAEWIHHAISRSHRDSLFVHQPRGIIPSRVSTAIASSEAGYCTDVSLSFKEAALSFRFRNADMLKTAVYVFCL
ncbi:uncharacterized protein CC84DRAFT_1169459 [Paraphaeosphaeria sporulosa]|uniref:Uncharacterized protein n=1 Tax=Paraphaeosphaeria sporulosa TaxID=1460663 RepID=A0A177BYC7_9PLEO|nr:uncharacterized protein CC84DRAFT_1169459 [Paraphaeosphaeria sporulosa]OAF99329.1 hypothetical protein CC84DRAFT_1169459 [Paraphaeosphaeria sporulosa]